MILASSTFREGAGLCRGCSARLLCRSLCKSVSQHSVPRHSVKSFLRLLRPTIRLLHSIATLSLKGQAFVRRFNRSYDDPTVAARYAARGLVGSRPICAGEMEGEFPLRDETPDRSTNIATRRGKRSRSPERKPIRAAESSHVHYDQGTRWAHKLFPLHH